MTMKSGLVSLLTGEGTITALVSSRVYVNKAPQKAVLPHIIITQLNSNEMNAFDGTSELRSINYDIDCKADRSVEAATLADAVRVFLDDYTGAAGSETIGAVLLNDESDSYEPPTDASDVGIYVVTLDLDVMYNPA